jgi:hypothetical protein
MGYLKMAQEAARRIEERKKRAVCPEYGNKAHLKEHLGECSNPGCGSPAWGKDDDGKPKCWCCLAIPGLFGKH